MKRNIERHKTLTKEEQRLINVAYKKLLDCRRLAIHEITDVVERNIIRAEIDLLCEDAIALLRQLLDASGLDIESQVILNTK